MQAAFSSSLIVTPFATFNVPSILNTDRKNFFRDIVNDDKYYDILKNDDKSSMRIIFLSVFTYYKRRNESNGE